MMGALFQILTASIDTRDTSSFRTAEPAHHVFFFFFFFFFSENRGDKLEKALWSLWMGQRPKIERYGKYLSGRKGSVSRKPQE